MSGVHGCALKLSAVMSHGNDVCELHYGGSLILYLLRYPADDEQPPPPSPPQQQQSLVDYDNTPTPSPQRAGGGAKAPLDAGQSPDMRDVSSGGDEKVSNRRVQG